MTPAIINFFPICLTVFNTWQHTLIITPMESQEDSATINRRNIVTSVVQRMVEEVDDAYDRDGDRREITGASTTRTTSIFAPRRRSPPPPPTTTTTTRPATATAPRCRGSWRSATSRRGATFCRPDQINSCKKILKCFYCFGTIYLFWSSDLVFEEQNIKNRFCCKQLHAVSGLVFNF